MSSVADRLVQQTLRRRQREAALAQEKETLREKEELRAQLQKRRDEARAQLQRVEAVRVSLNGLQRTAQEKYEEACRSDEEERANLSEKLRVAIDAVNAFSEEITQLEARARHENSSLKEQLEIYAKFHATGEDKYNEIMQAREAEYEKIAAKRDAAQERKPQLLREIEEETKELETAVKARAALQEEVDGWVNHLSEVQQRLLKARETFESAKDEKERQVRRIRSLESDRQLLISRVEKSKAERDKEHAKVEALEEKINACKKQTGKLLAVVALLDSKDTDVEVNEKV
ncbi:Taxilin family [Trypanosoma melophagium]|uniref:Taxilin family n=1 Tax=Trypanosoma melophagium TaxID=715481 RepID=UPI00351AA0AA|nr:Taxilin family [Trypanosoma melophagium]